MIRSLADLYEDGTAVEREVTRRLVSSKVTTTHPSDFEWATAWRAAQVEWIDAVRLCRGSYDDIRLAEKDAVALIALGLAIDSRLLS